MAKGAVCPRHPPQQRNCRNEGEAVPQLLSVHADSPTLDPKLGAIFEEPSKQALESDSQHPVTDCLALAPLHACPLTRLCIGCGRCTVANADRRPAAVARTRPSPGEPSLP